MCRGAMPGRATRWLLALSTLIFVAAACGADPPDGASSPPTSASPTTTAAAAGGAAALATCPFSGSTAATGESTGASSAVVSKVTTSKSGCVDNIAFDFSTLPPAWSLGYGSGPFQDAATGAAVSVPGPTTLVLTFQDTKYGDNKTPTTVSPSKLDYVTNINVITGPNGSLEWILSLPQQAQFQTSLSNVPANFTLAIG